MESPQLQPKEIQAQRSPRLLIRFLLFLGISAAMLMGFVLSEDGTVPFEALIGLIVPVLLFPVTGLFILSRTNRKVRIDPMTKSVTVKKGLFGGDAEEISMSRIKKVEIHSETRGSGKNRYRVYPVRLDLKDASPVEMSASKSYTEARQGAESIARTAHKPLEDHTIKPVVVRLPEHLDEPLVQRLQREDDLPTVSRPIPMLTKIVEKGGQNVAFLLPKKGFTLLTVGFGIFGVLGVLMFGIPMWFVVEGEGPISHRPELFFPFFPLLIIAPVVLVNFFSREKIILDGRSLTVRRSFLFFFSNQSIPLHQLEELFLAGDSDDPMFQALHQQTEGHQGPPRALVKMLRNAQQIVARSDHHVIHFGGSIPPKEKQWLCAELLRRLKKTSLTRAA